MKIDIRQIDVIVREFGTDKVIIHTNSLMPTVYPWIEPGALVMDIAHGEGAQYVRENFGMEGKVIHV